MFSELVSEIECLSSFKQVLSTLTPLYDMIELSGNWIPTPR